MPWLETSPVEQRERFIRDHRLELYSMVELCTRYGISRKPGYKWFDRFEDCPARFARTSRRHQRWNHPPEKAAAVHRQRAQATPHRPRGGRRRHLVHSLLQRPLGTRRRTGLHHQGVAACYPCLPVFLLPMFPVAHRLLGSRFNVVHSHDHNTRGLDRGIRARPPRGSLSILSTHRDPPSYEDALLRSAELAHVGINRGRRPSAACRGYAGASTPPFDYMSDLT